ncbi:WD40 repeat domain-containing protein [Streptomyces sp. NPDC002886]|uniref:WD40 repeat domain-containing protein n=1 Tax=Streptomyces sp. NPDC002886 TaxID=3364667 RepID=UPI0036C01740
MRLRRVAMTVSVVIGSLLAGCDAPGGEGKDSEPRGEAREALSARLAERSLAAAKKDPRLATALAQEAAGLGHGEKVVAALNALASPHLVLPLTTDPADGVFRLLRASAEGRVVAGASDAGAVVVWDTYTGKPVLRGGLPAAATELAVSPSGTLVAAATAAGDVRVWSTGTRKEAARFTRPADGNTGLAFDIGGAHLLSGSGAAIEIRDTKIWTSAARMPAEPAGSVRDLAFLWDSGFPEPTLVAVSNGGVLQRFFVGQRKRLDGVPLTKVSREPVPHRFGPTSGVLPVVGLTGAGRSRFLRLDTSPRGAAAVREEFVDSAGTRPRDPMEGDGAGSDEYEGQEDGDGTGGSPAPGTPDGLPDQVLTLSVIDHNSWVASTSDRTRAVVRGSKEDTSAYTELWGLGPGGKTEPISALVAWEQGNQGSTAAFGIDDGRVLLWTFSRQQYPEDPLRPEAVDVDDELLRLCRAAPVELDETEWRKHLPGVPYKPACRAALEKANAGYGEG